MTQRSPLKDCDKGRIATRACDRLTLPKHSSPSFLDRSSIVYARNIKRYYFTLFFANLFIAILQYISSYILERRFLEGDSFGFYE